MRVPVIVATGVVLLAAGATAMFLMRPSSPPESLAPRAVVPPPVVPRPPAAPPESAATPAVPRRTPSPAAMPEPAAAPPEAAPTMGTLIIETDVPDASVLIDRVGVGTAPITVPNLTPGSHRLNVSATGYDGYAETIEVEPGTRTISIKFKEIRLDLHLAAVHKHALGSCKGRLTASPQEIRYTAADGKDTFAVALTDIESMAVDYLAKNFRIRTRQGRTYNLTDPDGNADRLFVFHRDVEKVRSRLGK